MQSTQKKMLEYLQSHPASSAREISLALGMTPANIRHHLQGLTAAQMVTEAGTRPTGGRGRPVILFSLHQHAMAHSLDQLAEALLRCWSNTTPSDSTTDKMTQLAAEFAGSFVQPAGSLTACLGRLVQQLNERHYQAHWEAHAKGPLLRYYNCPYAEILPRHPELCQMDTHLIQILICHPTHQINKMTSGTSYCTFQIIPV